MENSGPRPGGLLIAKAALDLTVSVRSTTKSWNLFLLPSAGNGQGLAAGIWWLCCSGVHAHESLSSQNVGLRERCRAWTQRPWKRWERKARKMEELRRGAAIPFVPFSRRMLMCPGSERDHHRNAMLLVPSSHRLV